MHDSGCWKFGVLAPSHSGSQPLPLKAVANDEHILAQFLTLASRFSRFVRRAPIPKCQSQQAASPESRAGPP